MARAIAQLPPPPDTLEAEIETMPRGGALIDLRSQRNTYAWRFVAPGGLLALLSLAIAVLAIRRGADVPVAGCVLIILGFGAGLGAAGYGLVGLQQHFRFEFDPAEVRFDRPFRPPSRWPLGRVCAVSVMSDDATVVPPVPGGLGRPSGTTKVRVYLDDRWEDIRGGLSPNEHRWLATMLAGALGVPMNADAGHAAEHSHSPTHTS